MYSIDSPLLAEPQATLTQCVNYVVPRITVNYTAHDVQAIILPSYFTLARSIGLDPILAIAQMCHETGYLSSWWCARPRRNPAGIGVNGRTAETPDTKGPWQYNVHSGLWHAGIAFPTWTMAIAAHVGRLAAYASKANPPLVQNALAVRSLPARYRGIAPTLRGLGGSWAVPGKTYAYRLAVIANRICRMDGRA